MPIGAKMMRVKASTSIEELVNEVCAGYNIGPDQADQQKRCIAALHGELIFNVKSLWRIAPQALGPLLQKLSLPLLLQSELLKLSKMNPLPSPYRLADSIVPETPFSEEQQNRSSSSCSPLPDSCSRFSESYPPLFDSCQPPDSRPTHANSRSSLTTNSRSPLTNSRFTNSLSISTQSSSTSSTASVRSSVDEKRSFYANMSSSSQSTTIETPPSTPRGTTPALSSSTSAPQTPTSTPQPPFPATPSPSFPLHTLSTPPTSRRSLQNDRFKWLDNPLHTNPSVMGMRANRKRSTNLSPKPAPLDCCSSFLIDGKFLQETLPPVITDSTLDVVWNTKFKIENEPEKTPPVCRLERVITGQGITLKHTIFAFIRRTPEPCFVIIYQEQIDEDVDLMKPIDGVRLKGLKSTPVSSEILNFQRADSKGIQSWLQTRFGGPFQIINEDSAIEKMLTLEANIPIALKEYRVSAIYCRKGQVDPMDMFTNGMNSSSFVDACGNKQDMLSPAATDFFQLIFQINPAKVDPAFLSDGIKNNWEDKTFLWHFAPIMTEEQQRSFIGNDNAVVFFKDEGEPFDPSLVANMGAMPQIFLVVQPFQDSYRIGCFKKALISPYKPYISSDFLFTKESCRTAVLTKLANGMITSIQCPPLLSFLSRPRQEAMKKIIDTVKAPKMHKTLLTT